MKKRRFLAGLLSAALLCAAAPLPVFAGAGDETGEENPTSLSAKPIAVMAPEEKWFDQIDLTVSSSCDAEAGTGSIELACDFALNNDAIQGATNDHGEDFWTDDEQPVSFSFDVNLSGDVEIPDALPTDKPLFGMKDDPETSAPIATYTITKTDEHAVNVALTFNKAEIDERQDVKGRLSQDFAVAGDDIIGLTLGLGQGEGAIDVSVGIKHRPTTGGNPDVDYTLGKELVDRTDITDPKIEYKLTAIAAMKDASAEDTATLAGFRIEDQIPGGLTVTAVSYNGTLLKAEQYTIDEKNKFSFTIPDDADGAAVKTAELLITTYVNKSKYEEFLNSHDTQIVEETFKNTAALWAKDGEEPLDTTDEVEAAFGGTFFNKEGKLAGNNGGVYHWTITANTHFTSVTNAFIVDTINAAHNYKKEADGTVKYTAGGKEHSASPLAGEKTGAAYDALTAENVETLLDLTEGGTKAVYYDVGDHAVLIIPLDEGLWNAPLTIGYDTVVANKDGNKMTNKAKILWQEATGGPGIFPPFNSGDVEKEETPNITDFQKHAGTYNADTQQMSWQFDVNHKGAAMEDVVITDVLDDKVQTFDSITDIAEWNGTGEKPETPYYQLTRDTGEKTTTVTVTLGTIAADTLVSFELRTNVVAPSLLNGTSGKLPNTAKISYKSGDKDVTKDAAANPTISNTLLQKSVIGAYNFTDHTFQWKVTVNPQHLTLKDAVLTDVLPEGTEFCKLTGVTRSPKNGEKETATLSDEAIAGNGTIDFASSPDIKVESVDKGNPTFTFDPAKFTDTYVFTFTTLVTDAHRDANFKAGKTVTFTNEAQLRGLVLNPNDDAQTAAIGGETGYVKATATNSVTPPPIGKSGEYFSAGGEDSAAYPDLGRIDYAKWTVLINPDKVDLKGATVKDALIPELELDPASMQIRKVSEINNNGTVKTLGDPLTGDELAGLQMTDRGFTFAIPDALARVPLHMTFNTLVIAENNTLHNGISLDYGGGEGTEKPEDAGDVTSSFDMADYISSTPAPTLRVKKVSSNKDINGADVDLEGAVFTLTPQKNENGKWITDESKRTKSAVSRLGKNMNFMFLSRDTLYLLEETVTPGGYKTMPPQYFVFDGTETGYPEGTQNMPWDNAARAFVYKAENTPTGTLTFTKCVAEKNEEDTLIAGDPLPNIKFTLKLKDTAIERTATSGPDGVVSFTELDPGTYIMTEDDTLETFTVTVTAGAETQIVEKKVTNAKLLDGNVITNKIDTEKFGTITGQKTKTSGTGLAGAVIGLYPSPEEDGALPLYTATSGADGKFTFTLVKPGEYTLREISAPSGYEMNTETVFTVEAAANTVVKKDTSDQDIVIVNKRTPSSGGGGGGSSNGRLVIEKSSDDGAKAGFTFRIKGSGYDKTFVTNSAGKIEIAALAVGTYTVTEMETGATAKYEIPDGQTVKLTGKGATVSFHNKLKPGEPDEPGKPGDPDEPGKPGDPTEPGKPGDPTEPGKPGDPTDPNDPHNPPPTEPGKPGEPGHSIDPNDTPKGGTEGGGNKTLLNPQTSYRSPLPMWIAMALLSAVGFALCAIRLRRRRYRGRHVR